MNSKPYFQIRPDGTINVLPTAPKPVSVDCSKKPVQFAVLRAPLGLKIHGENFAAVINLTADDALTIAMLLAYAVREEAFVPAPAAEYEAAQ